MLSSDQVNIAGVAPMMIYDAKTEVDHHRGRRRLFQGARRRRLYRATTERLRIRRTVVPASPDVCLQALERFGTLRYSDVAARAIKYAAEGFPRHQVMLDYVTQYVDDLRHFEDNMAILMPGGEIPALGSKLVQTWHERFSSCATKRLRLGMIDEGLARVDAFYAGDIANGSSNINVKMTVCLAPKT